MSINPLSAATEIDRSHRSYLTTTFRFQDPVLQAQFAEELQKKNRFCKGPILEATPAFKTGASIADLVKEGVLSAGFLNLNTPLMPPERALYQHQERAIRKVCAQNRNIVVATGTGSGKTETFLVPIFNHLFREDEAGTLGPGVRALLLYPMNALANDQLARLRLLLANCPKITFGRYTGETRDKHSEALELYRKTHHFGPLPNELISREQMRTSPPHILLTNYAMLEYLLLRPEDSVFFDGEYAGSWKFIVIDEAHTYSGAKAIEMAMLLRRLKDRIDCSEPGRLTCIATSATLGSGKKEFGKIAEFASELFGERFEWDESRDDNQDVIDSQRLPLVSAEHEQGSWGTPSPEVYVGWQKIIDDDPQRDREMLIRLKDEGLAFGVPEYVLNQAFDAGASHGWTRFLFEALKGDRRLLTLRSKLQEGPCNLTQLQDEVLPGIPGAGEALVALVDLASQARADKASQPLLPARYHFFVRSLEGAYVLLKPRKKLFLDRTEAVLMNDGRRYAVFEVGTCRQCGALYLVGTAVRREDGKTYLEQRRPDGAPKEYYLLTSETFTSAVFDEDEDIYGLDSPKPTEKASAKYILCGACGAIDRAEAVTPICDCGSHNYHYLSRVKTNEDGNVRVCPACGRRHPRDMVGTFQISSDAIATVLASALYQEITPDKKPERPSMSAAVNAWSTTRVDHTPGGHAPKKEGNRDGARRLLIFSDSRQDAAFFAPYFDQTYNRILQRRLIMKTLEDHRDEVLRDKWRLQDIIEPLCRTAKEAGVFGDRLSPKEQSEQAWKWVLYEFLACGGSIGLENLGLLGFSLVRPEGWISPPPLLSPPWNLTEEEAWTLFQVLLDTLRVKGAVAFPSCVTPGDDFFEHGRGIARVKAFSDEESRRKAILGWNSAGLNRRLDYLIRLAGNLGPEITNEECRQALSAIWEFSLELTNPRSCWRGHFSAESMRGEGVAYQLRYDVWELRPTLLEDSIQWYRCDKCGGLTLHNIRGACPNYRCSGTLRRCNPAEAGADNHYYRQYLTVSPFAMAAREHTAQLTSEAAAELQNDFITGRVNVLSCSTTFELGVDVGELETVFMRNVPPSSANYIQRAGRAGRRTESTAFVLTFAQNRPHDRAHLDDPLHMVSGKVRAPHFKLENAKIVLRHMYATALAAFWRQRPDLFGKVKQFFFNDGRPGPGLFADFLRSHPADLQKSLMRIVPVNLYREVGMDTWAWADQLFEGEEPVLTRAYEELIADVEQITRVREENLLKGRKVDHLTRLINTIKDRDLIGFLSSRNIIPKYGFPVDVVELQLQHHGEEAKKLQLQRDLRIALSEYAPSSQVVAGGKLWTSRYIKRPPQKEWHKYLYAICDNCHAYTSSLYESGERPEKCKICGQPLGKKRGMSGVFVVPSFGFISDGREPEEPGNSRPEKTHTTRVYYSGEAIPEKEVLLDLQGITLKAIPASHGKLAVINDGNGKGFAICGACGYSQLQDNRAALRRLEHKTPWGAECKGSMMFSAALGHEFKTDVLTLSLEGYSNDDRRFWISLLYALLEGASRALQIERQDLDGCLYGPPDSPQIVLFDDVPGGAGHVRRMAAQDSLLEILKAAREQVERCNCGGDEGDASCYGCLRNYRNQFCHDELRRGLVMRFLRQILPVDYPELAHV